MQITVAYQKYIGVQQMILNMSFILSNKKMNR
jgi:hypothetical protein